MKLRKSIMFILFITIFFMSAKVYAYCDSKAISQYKKEAYKVEFDYNFDDSFNTSLEYYMNVTATNLNKNLMIKDSSGATFLYDESSKEKFSNLGTYDNGAKVVFTVYTSVDTPCPNTSLYKKTYQLPHYNIYSKHVACKGNEEFELCDRWYPKEIENEKNFVEAVHAYEKEKADKPVKDEKVNFADQVLNFLKNYYILLVITIVIAIVVVVIRKLNKDKKKIKIKLED